MRRVIRLWLGLFFVAPGLHAQTLEDIPGPKLQPPSLWQPQSNALKNMPAQAELEQLFFQGKYDQAIVAAERVSAEVARAQPDNDSIQAVALINLAIAQQYARHHAAAVVNHQKAISLLEKTGSYRDIRLAEPLARLGMTLHDWGRHDDAAEVLARSVFITRAEKGLKSQAQLKYYPWLMHALVAAGQHEEALRRQQSRVSIIERALGADSPETLIAYEQAAQWHHYLGDYLEERRLHLRRHDLIVEREGYESPKLIPSLYGIAGTYQALLDPDLIGLQALTRAQDIQEKSPDATPLEKATTQDKLGDFYMTFGRHGRGIGHYKRAIRLLNAGGQDDIARQWYDQPRLLLYYPPDRSGLAGGALKQQFSATVLVSLEIDKQGKPRNIELKTITPDKAEHMKTALRFSIRDARFRPAVSLEGSQYTRGFEQIFRFRFVPE